jgi:hypothetical protein
MTPPADDELGPGLADEQGPTEDVCGALAAGASHDLVLMAVGAVMALHSLDQASATSALRQAASRFQVPEHAVAQALLSLTAGSDEPFSERAGAAAVHLLAQGFTQS